MIDANSIRIGCERFGENKGSTVVLIAGAMASAMFGDESFYETLAKIHLVMRFDKRDFGYSTTIQIWWPMCAASWTIVKSSVST